MGLHSIIEPAGTLMTGWELVPESADHLIDVRNKDHAPTTDATGGDRTPIAETASKWEDPVPGSIDDLCEIRESSVAETAPHP